MSGHNDISVRFTPGSTIVDIEARGGSRRERGARIAAAVRREKQNGITLKSVSVSYSETYGFLSATYARYSVA